MATDISGEYVVTPTAMNDRQKRGARMTQYGALVVAEERPDGTTPPAGTVADPTFYREVGAPSLSTGQNPSSVSPATSLQIVAARSGRRSVTFTNITGTQPVYFTATSATTGVTTGHFLAGTLGATISIGTQSAIFATSPTAAQTISFAETF